LAVARRADCAKEMDAIERFGARLLLSADEDYPEMLASLPDKPPLLVVKGDAALFRERTIAIIGARNASTAGRKLARLFAEGVGRAGVVVVSGLARGIDGAAHEAALRTGTIAVVAGGIDVVYPPEHARLQAAIGEQGLIVSERPFGSEPQARDFPRRNRIVSGLSIAVVVVEAAAKSGTRITADFALEQGRDVFAAPGSPLDPRCNGSNRLIREGALLVETAEDILDGIAGPRRRILSMSGGATFEEDAAAATPAFRARVLDALSFAPMHRDEIIRDLEAPPGLVADALLDLVLSGEAEEHPGGRFARV
ncbi:MAG: DNA-processing protein DprA, partial [Parvularculaceae bacterium]|nr:DNA-processing protein DprA [Parvularculaceae bacterium]